MCVLIKCEAEEHAIETIQPDGVEASTITDEYSHYDHDDLNVLCPWRHVHDLSYSSSQLVSPETRGLGGHRAIGFDSHIDIPFHRLAQPLRPRRRESRLRYAIRVSDLDRDDVEAGGHVRVFNESVP
jgi:hypothetical protein